MTMKVKDGGGVLRTITGLKVLDGSTLRRIVRAKVMDADGVTLRTVATFVDPLSVAITPSPVTGSTPRASGRYTQASAATATSQVGTATPTGGLGPYAYSWVKVSGDTITAVSPASAATTFSGLVPTDSTISAVFRVTCSDSSAQSATATVTVELTNNNVIL